MNSNLDYTTANEATVVLLVNVVSFIIRSTVVILYYGLACYDLMGKGKVISKL